MNIFILGDLFLIISLIVDLILFILIFIKSKNNNNLPIKRKNKNPKIAILIPARDESKVIEDLLYSIKMQSEPVNMEDVYVIVEDIKDKTVEICYKYNTTVVIRKNLELKRKGYALDEGIKFILSSNKKYDAYFIFDADNILDVNYLKNMKDTYREGYDIGIGYRNTKNGNDNVISACSTLTFSMINGLGNSKKNKDTRNVTISGTGFYICGDFIEKWGGYPFHTLTEDYELTLYSSLHSMTSYYNEKAIFFDEQPTEFKVTIDQRTRWIRGFIDARKIYARKLLKKAKDNSNNSGSQFIEGIGVLPYLILVLAAVINILIKLIGGIYLIIIDNYLGYIKIWELCLLLIIIYIILFIVTGIMICKENKCLNLSYKSKIKALFFNPLFLASYIYCAIVALFNKNISWSKIEHTKNVIK